MALSGPAHCAETCLRPAFVVNINSAAGGLWYGATVVDCTGDLAWICLHQHLDGFEARECATAALHERGEARRAA